MNLSHNTPLPKITREVEQDVLSLYDAYEREEFDQAEVISRAVWCQARQIFESLDRKTPYFLIFMARKVFERSQSIACTFAICPFRKDTGERIKDSLVWFCDKPKGVFRLATDLCDLRPSGGLL